MSALGTKLRSVQDGGISFWCPGCDSAHGIKVGAGDGPRWTWDGNVEAPTFAPSILVRRSVRGQSDGICHSFVRAGCIEFLGDCTHSLAGQTIDLPTWPRPDWRD